MVTGKKVINLKQGEQSFSHFEMQKLLKLHKVCYFFFWRNGTNASHRKRTFKTLSDGKLHCFPKQYWNQNKYFILISIDFSTRVCSRSLFRYIFSPKLKGYRDVSISEFCLQKVFFLLASNPKEKVFFSSFALSLCVLKSDKRREELWFWNKSLG